MLNKSDLILSPAERKELLFELVNNVDIDCWGPAATWTTLGLIVAVGKGGYYSKTNNSLFAKNIKSNNPPLYDQLQVFFHQNRPDDWDKDDE